MTWKKKENFLTIGSLAIVLAMLISCEFLEKELREVFSKPVSNYPFSDDAIAMTHFSLAMQYLSDGDVSKARVELERCIKLDPNSSYLHFRYAEVLAMEEKGKDAEKEARLAIELNPLWVEPYLFLADYYLFSKNPKEAGGISQRALELFPDNEQATIYLSDSYLATGQVGAGLVVLRNYLDRYPYSVLVQHRLANDLMRLGRYEEAKAEYEKLINLSPSFYYGLVERAQLFQLTGEVEKSISAYREIIELYPEDSNLYAELLTLLVETNRLDEAEEELARAKSVNPSLPLWNVVSGYIYLKRSDYRSARRKFEEVLKTDQNNTDAIFYMGLVSEGEEKWDEAISWFSKVVPGVLVYEEAQTQIGWCYYKLGKKDKAIEFYEKLLKEHPGKKSYYLGLVWIYQDMEDYENAQRVIEDAIKNIPQDTDLLYQLGVIYELKGEHEKSIEQMRAVLSISPNNAQALNFIGYSWAEQGINLDEAERYIKKALEEEPQNSYIMDSLGWVYYKKGNLAEAYKWIKKAFDLSPKEAEIIKHLAEIYIQFGRKEDAKELLKRALELKPKAKLKKEIEALLEGLTK